MKKLIRSETVADSNGRPFPRPQIQYLSCGFKATRKNGDKHVHVEPVEEYPRALPPTDAKVRKDKYGNYSALFLYRTHFDAERERWNFETLERFYDEPQEKLYKRYVDTWETIQTVAGQYFKPSYIYKLTFSKKVHYNIIHKKVKVSPVRLLRLLQASSALTSTLANLSNFNKNNCPWDYSLGRKPPL